MPTRDQDCYQTEVCRKAVLDLVFEGQFPSERHVEILLDRLERIPPEYPDFHPGERR